MVINNNIKNKLQTSITLAVNWAVTEIMTYKKLQMFNYLCGTITHTSLNKSQQETVLKFSKVSAVSALYMEVNATP
jgi:hypothetical protein